MEEPTICSRQEDKNKFSQQSHLIRLFGHRSWQHDGSHHSEMNVIGARLMSTSYSKMSTTDIEPILTITTSSLNVGKEGSIADTYTKSYMEVYNRDSDFPRV